MLTDAQVERYARQIVLPEIGGRGQARLLASRVQVLGDGVASRHAADLLRRAGVQVQDVEPSAVVDLRLDAPAAGAKAETPRVIGRMHQTCAMVESLPAGEPPHPDAPVQDRAALRADPALVACTLRALGALAASEALALLLNPDRRARRITLDLASGRFASQAPETCA